MTGKGMKKGKSFVGLNDYIREGKLDEHKDKKVEYIMSSDNLRTPRDVNDEAGFKRMNYDFISQSERHINYKKGSNYVGHHVLSFSEDDYKKLRSLSYEDKEQLYKDYIKRIGLEKTQWAIVEHGDTDHYHVHIPFNRVMNNGRLYDDFKEYNKISDIAVSLNLKYGFENIGKQKDMAETRGILEYRSEDPDIQALRKKDLLFQKAESLAHLEKICEQYAIPFSIEGDRLTIDKKTYNRLDVKASLVSNTEARSERAIEQKKQERIHLKSLKNGKDISQSQVDKERVLGKTIKSLYTNSKLTKIENALKNRNIEVKTKTNGYEFRDNKNNVAITIPYNEMKEFERLKEEDRLLKQEEEKNLLENRTKNQEQKQVPIPKKEQGYGGRGR